MSSKHLKKLILFKFQDILDSTGILPIMWRNGIVLFEFCSQRQGLDLKHLGGSVALKIFHVSKYKVVNPLNVSPNKIFN